MPGHSLMWTPSSPHLDLLSPRPRSSSERRFSSPYFGSIKMYQAAPAHTHPLSNMEVFVISFGFLHGAQSCPSVRTLSSCSLGSKPPASGTFPCSRPTHPAQVLILHPRLPPHQAQSQPSDHHPMWTGYPLTAVGLWCPTLGFCPTEMAPLLCL